MYYATNYLCQFTFLPSVGRKISIGQETVAVTYAFESEKKKFAEHPTKYKLYVVPLCSTYSLYANFDFFRRFFARTVYKIKQKKLTITLFYTILQMHVPVQCQLMLK